MGLISVSNFSDDLTPIDTVQTPVSVSLELLQEKIRMLGDMLSTIQSKQAVDLPALAEKVMPNVVRIEVDGGYRTIHGSYHSGSGSGCVISPDGYIVTNNHVIDGARKIHVLFHQNGLRFPATLVGSDPETDIALLKIDPEEEMSYSKFADSDLVQVGSQAILVGNPLGFQNLLTTGVIGGKSSTLWTASMDFPYYDPWDHGLYADYLFSDTLGNPGNSGGPLFNPQGDIIGVLARGASGAGGGIAMSITSNTAQKITAELKEFGYITRASLGAQIVPMSSQLTPYLISLFPQKSFEFWEENPLDGLWVADILNNSPAMKADLRKGDFITAYNDIPVTTQEQFYAYLAMRSAPFSELKLTLIRDGELAHVMVNLEKREVNNVVNIERLGILVENLEDEKYFTYELDSALVGVFVNAVAHQSDAIYMGLRPADVITAVIMDGQPEIQVRNVEDLVQILDQTDGDHQCVLVVRSCDRSRPSYVHIDLC